jgi:N utilization substance protein B
MTRSSAREIALICIYKDSYGNGDMLDWVLSEGFLSLAGEDMLFDSDLSESNREYIKDVVAKTLSRKEENEKVIAELSKGWKVDRISRMSMAILSLAMTEIVCRSDVPLSSAINEAVTLAKNMIPRKLLPL